MGTTGSLELVTLRGQRYLALIQGKVQPQVRDRREANNRLRIEAQAMGLNSVTTERGGRQVVDNGTSQEGRINGGFVVELLNKVTFFACYIHDVDRQGKTKKKIEFRLGEPAPLPDGLVPSEIVDELFQAMDQPNLHCFYWDNQGRGNLVLMDREAPGANEVAAFFEVEENKILIHPA